MGKYQLRDEKKTVIRFKREPVLKSKPCKTIRVKINDNGETL